MKQLFASLIGCLFVSGCVAYNQTCPQKSGEIVGETLRSLDLRQSLLRTRESPVGNLLADALLAEVEGADLALVPATLFERESGCGEKDFLDRGRLDRSDIEALLPSKEKVILVTVTSEDLRRVLERSVSYLASTEDNPMFLQVAGVLFTADCVEAAQTLTPDGKDVLFPGARVQAASIFVHGMPAAPGQSFKLATVATLVASASGYVDLARPGKVLVDTLKTPKDILIDHLRKVSPVDPKLEARMSLRDSCTAK